MAFVPTAVAPDFLERASDFVNGAFDAVWTAASSTLLGAAALVAVIAGAWLWWRTRHAIVFEPWVDRSASEQPELGRSLASLLLHRIRGIQAVHERAVRKYELFSPSYEVPSFQQPLEDDVKLLASVELGRYGELIGRLIALLFKLVPMLVQPARLRGNVLAFGSELYIQLSLENHRPRAGGKRRSRVFEACGKSGDLATLPELVEELAYKVYLDLIESDHFKSWRTFKSYVAGLSRFVDYVDVESEIDWDGARVHYEEALKHERNHPATSYNLGVLHYILMKRDHTARAAEHFRIAASSSDPILKAHALSGLANAECTTWHRYGVKSNPALLDDAMFHAQAAVTLAPKSDVVHKALAFVCHQKSEDLERRRRSSPPDEQHALKGEIERLRDRAIRHYRKATSINDRYFFAYNNLGNLYLEWAMRLQGDPAGQRRLLAKATAALERALVVRPSLELAHDNLANVHLALGELGDRDLHLGRAETHLRDALLHKPTYPEAMNDMARVCLLRAPADVAGARSQHARALAACEKDEGRKNKLCRQLEADVAKLPSGLRDPELAAAGCACKP